MTKKRLSSTEKDTVDLSIPDTIETAQCLIKEVSSFQR